MNKYREKQKAEARKRRLLILKMCKSMTQREVAAQLDMTPQRVGQLIKLSKEYGER